MDLGFKALFFVGFLFDLEGFVAVGQELVAPFVVLGLGALVFLAELGDLDLAG